MTNFACELGDQNTIYDGRDVVPVEIRAVLITEEPTLSHAQGNEVASLIVILYSITEFAATVGTTRDTVFVVISTEGLPGRVDDTNSNPLGILSVTVILLATDAPLLISLILNVTRSFNFCGLN